MKDYDKVSEIAALARDYKNLKEEQKNFTPAAAKKKVLDEQSEEFKETYNDIETKIDELKKTYNSEKKNIDKALDLKKDKIAQVYEQFLDDDTVASDKMLLPNVGSITIERKKEYFLNLTKEDKKKIIQQLIDYDMIELLEINEEAYINHVKKQFKGKDRDMPNIVRKDKVSITIR